MPSLSLPKPNTDINFGQKTRFSWKKTVEYLILHKLSRGATELFNYSQVLYFANTLISKGDIERKLHRNSTFFQFLHFEKYLCEAPEAKLPYLPIHSGHIQSFSCKSFST